jgi:ADP-heptose:LPS heptosyltransferase
MAQLDEPFDPAGGDTVLAIRMRQLGDVLATLGVLAALKKSGLAGQIIFVADQHYHELLRPLDYIDRLYAQPPAVKSPADLGRLYRYLESLRSHQARWVLDFHSNPRSALLTMWSGAPVRIGFEVRVRKRVYTEVEPRQVFDSGRPVPRNSQTAAFALARRMGLTEPAPPLLAGLEPDAAAVAAGLESLISLGVEGRVIRDGGLVGMNPGPTGTSKSWPDSYCVELINRLVKSGRQVVLMWGPGEEESARSIISRCHSGTFLAPALSLAELPGVLKNLACLITIDSGLKHLAACVRTPTVTMFGPTSPMEWHIGDDNDRYLYRELSCSPCRLLKCPFDAPCLSEITPDLVLDCASRLEETCGSK